MLAEFFEQVRQHTIADAIAKIEPVSGDPTRLLVHTPGGGPGWLDVPPPPMTARAWDISSVVRLCKEGRSPEFSSVVRLCKEGRSPEFWYGPVGVVGYPDGEDRRVSVTFQLHETPQFVAIKGLGVQGHQHKPFMKLLRTTLFGCLEPSLVHLLKTVKFSANAVSASDIQRQKSSVGKSLTADLETERQLPEMVNLRVECVFQGVHLPVGVGCALEVDPETTVFQLLPLPNQLDRAVESALDGLRVLLENEIKAEFEEGSDLPPVYFGSQK
jgi:hypothetical protein